MANLNRPQDNPNWSQEEVILALDFYLRHEESRFNSNSNAYKNLSQNLRKIGIKLHGEVADNYRNEVSVHYKMMNFDSLNPKHPKGMKNVSKTDEEIWNLYASNKEELARLAENIRSFINSDESLPTSTVVLDDEEDAEEGTVLTREHKSRERSAKLVRRKKAKVLKETGSLKCEVCNFDFPLHYGERGDGFIECHHTKPVSQLKQGDSTKISDLALVCSNCHRMIHRQRPWLSIDELRNILIAGSK